MNDPDTYQHRMQLIAIQTEAACAEREYWELKLKTLKWNLSKERNNVDTL
jgi:hypothetical protein